MAEHSQSDKHENNEVPIVIDKHPKKSPNPTTGAALYILAGINPAQYDLFRETRGQGDDEPILNNNAEIILKPGDHFYSAQKSLNPGDRSWN